MDWTEGRLLKLIEAYRNKSLLWDPKHKDHYRKGLKYDAWKEIAEEMDESVGQCRKKILSLLASNRREKRRIKDSIRTDGRSEIYESRWFGYEAFKFLDDKDLPRKELTTEPNEIIKVENDFEIYPVVTPSEPMEREVARTEHETITATPESSTARSNKRARRTEDYNSAMMKTALNRLKTAARKLEKEPPGPNEIDSFFTYVAAKVKKYSPEAQNRVQHAVFDVLVQADRGMFDLPIPSMCSKPYILQPHEAAVSHPAVPSQSRLSFSTNSDAQSSAASIASESFEDFM